jgi:hypothetical protein
MFSIEDTICILSGIGKDNVVRIGMPSLWVAWWGGGCPWPVAWVGGGPWLGGFGGLFAV